MPQSVGDQPLSPLPDDSALGTIVERARAGDGTAFASLFERYHIPIFRYLERLVGSPDIGRDLTQDTFLAAWRGLPGLQDQQRFSSWLYRIATNIARSHLRHARLIRWLPWAESDTLSGPHLMLVDPEEQVDQAEWVSFARIVCRFLPHALPLIHKLVSSLATLAPSFLSSRKDRYGVPSINRWTSAKTEKSPHRMSKACCRTACAWKARDRSI